MFKAILVGSAAVALVACASASDRVLERADVADFSLVELPGSPATLRISGLAFHSALAVQGITEKTEGDILHLSVNMTNARQQLSGSFTHDVRVPKNVNRVFFGEKGDEVWCRRNH